jgi:uncharacterized repeat protein (TIGR01451 family)
VFYDANQDSVYNTGDLYLSGMNVKKYPTGTWTTTNSNGYYRFIVAPGNYAIKLMANPAIIPVSTDSVNINVGSTSVGPIDFAVRPDSNYFYRKEVYLSGWPRCNTSQSYHAYYYGPTFIPGTLKAKFYHSPNTPFHYSIPAADSSVGDTVYITLPNNNVSSGSIDINIGIPSAGDTVSTSVILETYNWNGQLLGSDTSTLVMQVRCSFDPNDKSVSPAGETQMHYTLFSDSLFYNIRFQNTGNDTAYDILITDTLDPNLDVNSFVLVSASHDVVPEIFQNGLMKFRFYNIMLPDSGTNEPGSHGYINYIVAPKSGLPENTIVTNRAYIYFDQNAPVVTNMTDNTLVSQIPVSIHPVVKSNNFNLYPNPFSYSLTLRSAGAQVLPVVFEVSDAQGRLMKKISISDISTVIDLSGLSSGVYFYRIIGSSDACNEMGRLIKY